jgi:hypothetical protein
MLRSHHLRFYSVTGGIYIYIYIYIYTHTMFDTHSQDPQRRQHPATHITVTPAISQRKRPPSHPVQRDARAWGDDPSNTSDHNAYTPPLLTPPDTLLYKPCAFCILCIFCIFLFSVFYVFLFTLYIHSTCNTIQV